MADFRDIPAQRITTILLGGPADQGQTILFQFGFVDGSDGWYSCDHTLLPMLLGNLTEYGRKAEALRVSPGKIDTAAPYEVTSVARAGRTLDGKRAAIEFATNHGFPIALSMTDEQARQTIEFLQRELGRDPRQLGDLN